MIYLDNSSTSFPKAPNVAEKIYLFLKENARNINRTSSLKSYAIINDLITLRMNLASLAGHKDEETVFLNSGLTESINTVMRGFLNKGEHIIISSTEHNAVMRTISSIGLEYSATSADKTGRNNLDEIIKLKKDNTKAIVFSASSNVTGVNEDVKRLAEIAGSLKLPLIIDAAQALPYILLRMDEWNISALCFSGHKGLLGPEGTGGFIAQKDFAHRLKPLYTGGTGSFSDSFEMPEIFPDKFEAGTRNIPSLYGLSESVSYVTANLDELREKEKRNIERLLSGLLSLDRITVHGDKTDNRNAAISITARNMDISILADRLLKNHEIESRVGLHCASTAHRVMGTYPGGTLRLSPGPFTTYDEIDKTIDALKEETR